IPEIDIPYFSQSLGKLLHFITVYRGEEGESFEIQVLFHRFEQFFSNPRTLVETVIKDDVPAETPANVVCILCDGDEPAFEKMDGRHAEYPRYIFPGELAFHFPVDETLHASACNVVHQHDAVQYEKKHDR